MTWYDMIWFGFLWYEVVCQAMNRCSWVWCVFVLYSILFVRIQQHSVICKVMVAQQTVRREGMLSEMDDVTCSKTREVKNPIKLI